MLSDLQEACPNTWADAKKEVIGGEIWLNATIAIAECFDGAKSEVTPAQSPKSPVVVTSSASRVAPLWWRQFNLVQIETLSRRISAVGSGTVAILVNAQYGLNAKARAASRRNGEMSL